jgi:tRNA(Ser,Leu) C12 N-acetylase TAN1
MTRLAHTTNVFQTFDLVFFGTSKKLTVAIVGEFDDDSVNVQITKLVQAEGQTATSSTINAPFKKAGMDLDVTTRPFRTRIIEQTLRENSNLKDVWGRNVLLDDLSRRRHIPRFGIINSEFCRA